MRVAYQTIKTVQPDATVLSGGIASFHPRRFDDLNPDMDRRIVIEGQKWYDAIALHEHGPFGEFADSLDGPLAEYRKGLSENKPLWLTETGHNGNAHDKATVLVQKFIDNLSFWGNAGASSETIVILTYQVADAAPVEAGSKKLRNLASPRIRGEYYSFPLSGLENVKEPVAFTLTASRNGERIILKIDDLRVDGLVRR